jgi:hypothetical protein
MSDDLDQQIANILHEATAFRDELRFVARFVGIELSDVVESVGFEDTLDEIQAILRVMSAEDKADSSSSTATPSDASSIVTISAGGTVVAVSKATLLQAPSGSLLANMASDVWGHDLDSDGHIFQDVNPELFTLVIAHLRLKALHAQFGLQSEIPPILVFEEQRALLENMLAYYMMSEVPVKAIRQVNSLV